MMDWAEQMNALDEWVRARDRDPTIGDASRHFHWAARRIHALANESDALSVGVALRVGGRIGTIPRVADYILEYVG